MKINYLLLLALLLSGCVSTKNLTHEPRFKNVLGLKTLSHSALICEVDNDALYERKLPSLELYKNRLSGKCPNGQLVLELPEGTKVNFTKVSRTNLFALLYTEHWFLHGSVVSNNGNQDFYYYWGLNDCCINSPAHWEAPFWQ